MVWKGLTWPGTNISLPLRLGHGVEGLYYRLSIFVDTVCKPAISPVRSLPRDEDTDHVGEHVQVGEQVDEQVDEQASRSMIGLDEQTSRRAGEQVCEQVCRLPHSITVRPPTALVWAAFSLSASLPLTAGARSLFPLAMLCSWAMSR